MSLLLEVKNISTNDMQLYKICFMNCPQQSIYSTAIYWDEYFQTVVYRPFNYTVTSLIGLAQITMCKSLYALKLLFNFSFRCVLSWRVKCHTDSGSTVAYRIGFGCSWRCEVSWHRDKARDCTPSLCRRPVHYRLTCVGHLEKAINQAIWEWMCLLNSSRREIARCGVK